MNLSLTTISEVVNTYIFEQGKNPDERLRYTSILLGGLQHMQIHYLKGAKSEIVEVNDIGYVAYPSSMVSLIRLGGLFNGRIYPIYSDNSLSDVIEEDCGAEIPFLTPSDDIYYPSCYDFTTAFTNLSYKNNKDQRRIRINGTLPAGSQLVLTFVHNGVEDGIDTYVDRAYFQALYHWLDWKLEPDNMNKMSVFGGFLKTAGQHSRSFTLDELVNHLTGLRTRL
jgi:hypothetical protein